MNINLDNFFDEMDKKETISQEDKLVRELLEICYQNSSYIKEMDLSKYNSHIFLKVYQELFKKDIEDMKIVKDMLNAEYLYENIESTSMYIVDDEEIY